MVVALSLARRVLIRHSVGTRKRDWFSPRRKAFAKVFRECLRSLHLTTVRKTTTATVRHTWHGKRTEGRKPGATFAPVAEWELKIRYSLIDCAWLKAFGSGNIGDCEAWIITLVVNSCMENDTT